MPGGGFGYGEQYYDDSPLRSPCPRCGATEEQACDPVGPHKHATITNYHRERGMRPGELERGGYQPYILVDDSGYRLHLWRKPTQQPVRRGGWHPEPDTRTAEAARVAAKHAAFRATYDGQSNDYEGPTAGRMRIRRVIDTQAPRDPELMARLDAYLREVLMTNSALRHGYEDRDEQIRGPVLTDGPVQQTPEEES